MVSLPQFYLFFNYTLNQNTPLSKMHLNSNLILTRIALLLHPDPNEDPFHYHLYTLNRNIILYVSNIKCFKNRFTHFQYPILFSISKACFQIKMMFLNDNVSNLHEASTRGWHHVQWRHMSFYNESFVGTFLPYDTSYEKRVHLNV